MVDTKDDLSAIAGHGTARFAHALFHNSAQDSDFKAGHSGEIFAARFDPTGQLIASGSMDRSIST